MTAPSGVDSYLSALPALPRSLLAEIRARIKALAPEADERIAYAIPCARLNGRNFVYYAAWKHHVALYPIYRGPVDFEALIAPFRHKADTVRFMLADPVPWPVVEVILARQIALARDAAMQRIRD